MEMKKVSLPLDDIHSSTSAKMAQAHTSSRQIVTIEWDMMDKSKFFPLSMLSSFSVRCLSYPLTVIKTRIQIQKHDALYRGTYDAFRKIIRYEGAGGLYKGFWVNSVQIVTHIFYVGTYESVRHALTQYAQVQNTKIKGLVGGGCASAVGQTIIVPFDVVSQHMMIYGMREGKGDRTKVVNPLNIQADAKRRFDVLFAIIQALYRRHGVRGFYRGYIASICTYVPNSALWWSFYHLYSDWLVGCVPEKTPHLLVQAIAAPCGGITTCLLTNPLDVVRARMQVSGKGSIRETYARLWAEERWFMFTKGLSARVIQSFSFSILVIVGYESIKRWSVHEEYKDRIHW